MYFKVYLESDNLSSRFKRLRTATMDILSEFRDVSGNKIDFEFVDVFKDKTDKEKSEIIKQLNENRLANSSKSIDTDRNHVYMLYYKFVFKMFYLNYFFVKDSSPNNMKFKKLAHF